SGEPFVTDLGTVATDGSSGSGAMQIGPEGIRFFSADAPSQMSAWRLWLNGQTNSIMLKQAGVPLPYANAFDQAQSGQMLVVPPSLSVAQYFIGVAGNPGATINLDSRQQPVLDLPYTSSFTTNLLGYGYSTFRVVVPTNQIAWQLTLPSTNG